MNVTAMFALQVRMRKRSVFSHLYIETLILPRQARDKHRENSKKDAVFRRPTRLRRALSLIMETQTKVRKRHFLSHLYIK